MFIRKFAVAVATLVATIMLFATPANALPAPTAQFVFPSNPNVSGALSFYQNGTPPLFLNVNVHPQSLMNLPPSSIPFQIPSNPVIGGQFVFDIGPHA